MSVFCGLNDILRIFIQQTRKNNIISFDELIRFLTFVTLCIKVV